MPLPCRFCAVYLPYFLFLFFLFFSVCFMEESKILEMQFNTELNHLIINSLLSHITILVHLPSPLSPLLLLMEHIGCESLPCRQHKIQIKNQNKKIIPPFPSLIPSFPSSLFHSDFRERISFFLEIFISLLYITAKEEERGERTEGKRKKNRRQQEENE